MKEKLKKLFFEQKLTPYEISEIFRTDIETIKQLLIQYKITDKPKDRKYELIRKVPFSREQEYLLFGLLLGHAKILHDNRLVISTKNKDDILWIKQHLGQFINVITEKNKLFNVSFIHHGLTFFKKKFYDNTKKIVPEDLVNHFNDISLAAFYLQKGTYFRETIRFSTFHYTKEQNELIQHMLKLNFDIRSKVCEYTKNNNVYYFISVNKRNSEILMNIIRPYLDEYEYKFAADIKSRYMLEPPKTNQ